MNEVQRSCRSDPLSGVDPGVDPDDRFLSPSVPNLKKVNQVCTQISTVDTDDLRGPGTADRQARAKKVYAGVLVWSFALCKFKKKKNMIRPKMILAVLYI